MVDHKLGSGAAEIKVEDSVMKEEDAPLQPAEEPLAPEQASQESAELKTTNTPLADEIE